MKVTCKNCKGKIKIPDHKLPKEKGMFIPCPKCKHDVRIPSQKELMQKKAEAANHGEKRLIIPDMPNTPTPNESTLRIPDNVRSALVFMDEGEGDMIRPRLENAGYYTVRSSSPREAAAGVRFHVFDLILLDGDYDAMIAAKKGSKTVLEIIRNQNMGLRRQSFVVLLGENLKSMDGMSAFKKSVDMVLRKSDLNDLEEILADGMREKEAMYKVFLESMKKTG